MDLPSPGRRRAHSDGTVVSALEDEENLGDRPAYLDGEDETMDERQLSFRQLRHCASSVRHQKRCGIDIVTSRWDANSGKEHMKKLIMLVAALMAVAFVGLNYESIAYANDRAIPSIGVSGGSGSISVVWTAPTEAPYDYRLAWGLNGGYISYRASNTSTAGNAYPGGSATSYTITGLHPGTYVVLLHIEPTGQESIVTILE